MLSSFSRSSGIVIVFLSSGQFWRQRCL